jgi:hypothetical protein
MRDTRQEGLPYQQGQHLRAVVDRLQCAAAGSAELDTLIADALQPPDGGSTTRWSTDLSAAIGLLSAEYNFSVGRRDGICWAWIQPNDDWQPGEFQARHDHPDGSGLITAYTAALALMSAILLIRAARLEARPGLRPGPAGGSAPHPIP